MNPKTIEKTMASHITQFGSIWGPLDMASIKNSMALSEKLIGAKCIEVGKMCEVAKLVRSWANLQPAKVDLSNDELAKNLAICIMENINGREENAKFTASSGIRGLWK